MSEGPVPPRGASPGARFMRPRGPEGRGGGVRGRGVGGPPEHHGPPPYGQPYPRGPEFRPGHGPPPNEPPHPYHMPPRGGERHPGPHEFYHGGDPVYAPRPGSGPPNRMPPHINESFRSAGAMDGGRPPEYPPEHWLPRYPPHQDGKTDRYAGTGETAGTGTANASASATKIEPGGSDTDSKQNGHLGTTPVSSSSNGAARAVPGAGEPRMAAPYDGRYPPYEGEGAYGARGEWGQYGRGPGYPPYEDGEKRFERPPFSGAGSAAAPAADAKGPDAPTGPWFNEKGRGKPGPWADRGGRGGMRPPGAPHMDGPHGPGMWDPAANHPNTQPVPPPPCPPHWLRDEARFGAPRGGPPPHEHGGWGADRGGRIRFLGREQRPPAPGGFQPPERFPSDLPPADYPPPPMDSRMMHPPPGFPSRPEYPGMPEGHYPPMTPYEWNGPPPAGEGPDRRHPPPSGGPPGYDPRAYPPPGPNDMGYDKPPPHPGAMGPDMKKPKDEMDKGKKSRDRRSPRGWSPSPQYRPPGEEFPPLPPGDWDSFRAPAPPLPPSGYGGRYGSESRDPPGSSDDSDDDDDDDDNSDDGSDDDERRSKHKRSRHHHRKHRRHHKRRKDGRPPSPEDDSEIPGTSSDCHQNLSEQIPLTSIKKEESEVLKTATLSDLGSDALSDGEIIDSDEDIKENVVGAKSEVGSVRPGPEVQDPAASHQQHSSKDVFKKKKQHQEEKTGESQSSLESSSSSSDEPDERKHGAKGKAGGKGKVIAKSKVKGAAGGWVLPSKGKGRDRRRRYSSTSDSSSSQDDVTITSIDRTTHIESRDSTSHVKSYRKKKLEDNDVIITSVDKPVARVKSRKTSSDARAKHRTRLKERKKSGTRNKVELHYDDDEETSDRNDPRPCDDVRTNADNYSNVASNLSTEGDLSAAKDRNVSSNVDLDSSLSSTKDRNVLTNVDTDGIISAAKETNVITLPSDRSFLEDKNRTIGSNLSAEGSNIEATDVLGIIQVSKDSNLSYIDNISANSTCESLDISMPEALKSPIVRVQSSLDEDDGPPDLDRYDISLSVSDAINKNLDSAVCSKSSSAANVKESVSSASSFKFSVRSKPSASVLMRNVFEDVTADRREEEKAGGECGEADMYDPYDPSDLNDPYDTYEPYEMEEDELDMEKCATDTLDRNRNMSETLDRDRTMSHTSDEDRTVSDSPDKDGNVSVTLDKDRSLSDSLDKDRNVSDSLEADCTVSDAGCLTTDRSLSVSQTTSATERCEENDHSKAVEGDNGQVEVIEDVNKACGVGGGEDEGGSVIQGVSKASKEKESEAVVSTVKSEKDKTKGKEREHRRVPHRHRKGEVEGQVKLQESKDVLKATRAESKTRSRGDERLTQGVSKTSGKTSGDSIDEETVTQAESKTREDDNSIDGGKVTQGDKRTSCEGDGEETVTQVEDKPAHEKDLGCEVKKIVSGKRRLTAEEYKMLYAGKRAAEKNQASEEKAKAEVSEGTALQDKHTKGSKDRTGESKEKGSESSIVQDKERGGERRKVPHRHRKSEVEGQIEPQGRKSHDSEKKEKSEKCRTSSEDKVACKTSSGDKVVFEIKNMGPVSIPTNLTSTFRNRPNIDRKSVHDKSKTTEQKKVSESSSASTVESTEGSESKISASTSKSSQERSTSKSKLKEKQHQKVSEAGETVASVTHVVTKVGRTEAGRTKESKTKEGRTKDVRTKEDKTGQGSEGDKTSDVRRTSESSERSFWNFADCLLEESARGVRSSASLSGSGMELGRAVKSDVGVGASGAEFGKGSGKELDRGSKGIDSGKGSLGKNLSRGSRGMNKGSESVSGAGSVRKDKKGGKGVETGKKDGKVGDKKKGKNFSEKAILPQAIISQDSSGFGQNITLQQTGHSISTAETPFPLASHADSNRQIGTGGNFEETRQEAGVDAEFSGTRAKAVSRAADLRRSRDSFSISSDESFEEQNASLLSTPSLSRDGNLTGWLPQDGNHTAQNAGPSSSSSSNTGLQVGNLQKVPLLSTPGSSSQQDASQFGWGQQVGNAMGHGAPLLNTTGTLQDANMTGWGPQYGNLSTAPLLSTPSQQVGNPMLCHGQSIEGTYVGNFPVSGNFPQAGNFHSDGNFAMHGDFPSFPNEGNFRKEEQQNELSGGNWDRAGNFSHHTSETIDRSLSHGSDLTQEGVQGMASKRTLTEEDSRLFRERNLLKYDIWLQSCQPSRDSTDRQVCHAESVGSRSSTGWEDRDRTISHDREDSWHRTKDRTISRERFEEERWDRERRFSSENRHEARDRKFSNEFNEERTDRLRRNSPRRSQDFQYDNQRESKYDNTREDSFHDNRRNRSFSDERRSRDRNISGGFYDERHDFEARDRNFSQDSIEWREWDRSRDRTYSNEQFSDYRGSPGYRNSPRNRDRRNSPHVRISPYGRFTPQNRISSHTRFSPHGRGSPRSSFSPRFRGREGFREGEFSPQRFHENFNLGRSQRDNFSPTRNRRLSHDLDYERSRGRSVSQDLSRDRNNSRFSFADRNMSDRFSANRYHYSRSKSRDRNVAPFGSGDRNFLRGGSRDRNVPRGSSRDRNVAHHSGARGRSISPVTSRDRNLANRRSIDRNLSIDRDRNVSRRSIDKNVCIEKHFSRRSVDRNVSRDRNVSMRSRDRNIFKNISPIKPLLRDTSAGRTGRLASRLSRDRTLSDRGSATRGRSPRTSLSSRLKADQEQRKDQKDETKVLKRNEKKLKKCDEYDFDYLDELDKELEQEEEEEEVIPDWIRCSPSDLYFQRNPKTMILRSTKRMMDLEAKFKSNIVDRARHVRASLPPVHLPPCCTLEEAKTRLKEQREAALEKRKSVGDATGKPGQESKQEKRKRKDNDRKSKSVGYHSDDDDDSDDDDSDDSSSSSVGSDVEGGGSSDGEELLWADELNRKENHPERLHQDLWFNLQGEANDGPLCRCSEDTTKSGIRHNIYPGETPLPLCDPYTNNSDRLFHYRITMSPHTNFLTKSPTLISHDEHEYIFEGFSLFSHYKIDKVPICKVVRFNIEYTIHFIEEQMIENFDIRSLDLFADFLYSEVLEMVDLDWTGSDPPEGCRRFHVMPRFARDLPNNGKEILSMSEVLMFLTRSSRPIIRRDELLSFVDVDESEWVEFVDELRGMIVTRPGKRPCSVRVDQIDRVLENEEGAVTHPHIIHFGIKPAQLSYAGDVTYQKLWKQYMKQKHLVANKPKVDLKDRDKLSYIESKLQEMRLQSSMKREVTVEVSSEGFVRTGIKSDICQHALLLPVLVQHLRFHRCLFELEKTLRYSFKDRMLLQLALTHPSFKLNFGTNPDHARNSLTNCGFRQLEYGDRRINYVHTRKRGINTLMYIMSKMANKKATTSEINHYERLEFLGDAVIEFLSSVHLFFMFPRLEEGGLATYRAALVQNQHLAVLSEKLGLQDYMLYAHGSDLWRDLDLRHAMANCFEALMGSLYLDGGIDVVDRIFGEALFMGEHEQQHVWVNLPLHPLQEDEPGGDRHWIEKSNMLKKLLSFEEMTGVKFNHIRLLARAFTMRNIGFNNLTLGHNQTLEFLGDTVLQFISSEYLFTHFPEHHEGHLTLLRSSLVNNRTQAIICDDLGMTEFVINVDQQVKKRIYNEKNKVKDKADILEAFIGALYVDQGLESCKVLCQVCFFPRLKEFIINQDWNDAKSKLQQCCLTLREANDKDPDIPIYKVLQSIGPTNTRKYEVSVSFKGEVLATGLGPSIQQAEMTAASNALREKQHMFPLLGHVRKFLAWRFPGSSSTNLDETAEDQSRSNTTGSRSTTTGSRSRRHHRGSSGEKQDHRSPQKSASRGQEPAKERRSSSRSATRNTDRITSVTKNEDVKKERNIKRIESMRSRARRARAVRIGFGLSGRVKSGLPARVGGGLSTRVQGGSSGKVGGGLPARVGGGSSGSRRVDSRSSQSEREGGRARRSKPEKKEERQHVKGKKMVKSVHSEEDVLGREDMTKDRDNQESVLPNRESGRRNEDPTKKNQEILANKNSPKGEEVHKESIKESVKLLQPSTTLVNVDTEKTRKNQAEDQKSLKKEEGVCLNMGTDQIPTTSQQNVTSLLDVFDQSLPQKEFVPRQLLVQGKQQLQKALAPQLPEDQAQQLQQLSQAQAQLPEDQTQQLAQAQAQQQQLLQAKIQQLPQGQAQQLLQLSQKVAEQPQLTQKLAQQLQLPLGQAHNQQVLQAQIQQQQLAFKMAQQQKEQSQAQAQQQYLLQVQAQQQQLADGMVQLLASAGTPGSHVKKSSNKRHKAAAKKDEADMSSDGHRKQGQHSHGHHSEGQDFQGHIYQGQNFEGHHSQGHSLDVLSSERQLDLTKSEPPRAGQRDLGSKQNRFQGNRGRKEYHRNVKRSGSPVQNTGSENPWNRIRESRDDSPRGRQGRRRGSASQAASEGLVEGTGERWADDRGEERFGNRSRSGEQQFDDRQGFDDDGMRGRQQQQHDRDHDIRNRDIQHSRRDSHRERFSELSPERERFPQDRERFPKGRERFPHDRETFPDERERFPRERERFPEERERFAKDRERFPEDQERFPKGRERFPERRERVPQDYDRRGERFPQHFDNERGRSPHDFDRERERFPPRGREAEFGERSPWHRGREGSPREFREMSPHRNRGRSPQRYRERSPQRYRERSPREFRERSPLGFRGTSPHGYREMSPNWHQRERSPQTSRGMSPNRSNIDQRGHPPSERPHSSRGHDRFKGRGRGGEFRGRGGAVDRRGKGRSTRSPL